MKKVTQGLWSISQGKGIRCYLNVDATYTEACEGVMHPEQISEHNGLGVYGHGQLQDLAIAILLFERKSGRSKELLEKFNRITGKRNQ